MQAQRINPGPEYIYAMLHSWWGKAAKDDVLDELARCTTVGNLLHHLNQLDIINVKDADNVLGEFALRQYNQLGKLMSFCSSGITPFLMALQMLLRSENIKLMINYRFFTERVGHVSDGLVHFPGFPYLESQVHAMLTAPTTAQFVALLTAHQPFPQLREIIERLDRDRDLPAAEAAIETQVFLAIINATHHLPTQMRSFVLRLLTQKIDCENLMTLLRNAAFYHLSAEKLADSWIAGGRNLTSDVWKKFARSEAKVEEILAELPDELSSLVKVDNKGLPLYGLKRHFDNALYGRARKKFYEADNSELAVVAYPILLHFETINLRRIYEGIRFSLPVREITEMLIR